MTPERFAKLQQVLNQRQPDLTVISDYVHKGRNLSAIVRTADAAGVLDMHCVIGDKDYRAFRGTAMGSHHWVKVHRYRELQSPADLLKSQGFQIIAAHFSDRAIDYHQVDFTRPTAILLGAEREGVSELGETLADHHVVIPMMGMVASFNVSVAAGILLSEAQHQRQRAGFYDQRRISDEVYRQRLFEWAHPQVTAYCQANGLVYPALREDGEIDQPAVWYAKVRNQQQITGGGR